MSGRVGGGMQRTLMMIKPAAVRDGFAGRILARVEAAGLKPVAMRMVRLEPEEARAFYHVHAGKPFLDPLVAYMASGPIVALVLEGMDAIPRLREVVGATDPAKAAEGTIRRDFGVDIQSNAVHASDSPASAEEEIRFFALSLALRT
jgi:nucleoside-diphosphate kinase